MSENWSIKWHSEQLTPYASLKDQWIGYDDVKSVVIKSNYALDAGLGGVMVWSVETDDFRGNCGNGEYPLLTAINKVMRRDVNPNPNTERPQTSASTATTTATKTTTTTKTTESPSESTKPHENGPILDCSENGYFRDPTKCSNYFVCDEGRIFKFECPQGLMFNLLQYACDWETNVVC